MGLRKKNFDILGIHWKIWLLGGRSSQKADIEGGLPKKGAWTVIRFKGGVVFLRGADTQMHNMVQTNNISSNNKFIWQITLFKVSDGFWIEMDFCTPLVNAKRYCTQTGTTLLDEQIKLWYLKTFQEVSISINFQMQKHITYMIFPIIDIKYIKKITATTKKISWRNVWTVCTDAWSQFQRWM